MRTKYLGLLLFILLLLTSCKTTLSSTSTSTTKEPAASVSTTVTTTETTVTTGNTQTIKDVLGSQDNTLADITGIITAIDDSGNIFVQDAAGGIYVSNLGKIGLSLDGSYVGNTVNIHGIKIENEGLAQIKLTTIGGIRVVDDSTHVPFPVVVTDFSKLSEYQGLYIKLKNVNFGSASSEDVSVTDITDQDGNVIAKLYGGPAVQNERNVDAEGVYYVTDSRPEGMIINTLNNVFPSENLPDSELISEAKANISLPVNIPLNYKLPTYYKDVNISWVTDDPVIVISKGRLSRTDGGHSVINFGLTATFNIGTTTLKQTYYANLVQVAYYEIPTSIDYEGPTFPLDSLQRDFWGLQAGSQQVTFDRCVDGDTAHFLLTEADGTKKDESVRFYVIDTKESTLQKDEWGKDASLYTCNLLTHAKTIYLQGDYIDGPRDIHGRVLAWIWADGQLVQWNLVSIGLADTKYASYNGSGKTEIYTQILNSEQAVAKEKQLGEWGMLLDPYWNYETNSPLGW